MLFKGFSKARIDSVSVEPGLPVQLDTVMIRKKMCPADWAMATTLLAPLVFDIWAWRKDQRTVSVRFGQFLADPKSRAMATVVWLGISAHLFWGLPLPGQKTLKVVVTRKRKN